MRPLRTYDVVRYNDDPLILTSVNPIMDGQEFGDFAQHAYYEGYYPAIPLPSGGEFRLLMAEPRETEGSRARSGGFGFGRDPRVPRFYANQLANEALQAYFATLPSAEGDALQDQAGNLIPVEGIDF